MKNYLYSLLFLSLISQAQIINFPDANFKAKLMQSSPSESIARDVNYNFVKIDSNDDNEIDVAEASVIYYLQIGFGNINSLSGIENFVNLRGLECYNNNLTTLSPISSLIQMTYLSCPNNQITSLSAIENLTNLTDLGISSNPIVSVNLSNFHQLWRLWAGYTLLTEINLCGTAVTWLWATDNPNLQALYLKNNIISSDLARTSAQIPPPLHNFEFYNTPLLNYICYDDGEYPAVFHGIGENTSGKTLTTSCDSSCSLSVNNPIANNYVSLYPNPTSGIINIMMQNDQSINRAVVSNVLGQSIMIFENTKSLDISLLTHGTYLITVETDSGRETQRVIKH
ncbi:T9SS type A sorting domain-containing protein [Flavobacterium sp. AS60]|uniref:T9SS type A sorting domain-containing protein n=1 Tax=Flavobacterium anseongense TaxID=2910677 RepID=UPI001F2C0327|nr:T9SS type A sorting domain-containing protein [Flavobacterium sp. AS60]MCF6130158.1 T9SS type A sorting domain-containing protein [Flavobacterium sp. AS60]